MKINMFKSDLVSNMSVTKLNPMTYYNEEVEPKSRADYSITSSLLESNRPCSCLRVDEEGRVLISKLPKVNINSIRGTAKVFYQGYNATMIITINVIAEKPSECLPPTEDDCFSGHYKFKVYQQIDKDNEEFLEQIGTNNDCYTTKYSKVSDKHKSFRLDNGKLYFTSPKRDSTTKFNVTVNCKISLSGQDNTAAISFNRPFSVEVEPLRFQTYPSVVTRTFSVHTDDIKKSGKMLLTWCWVSADKEINLSSSGIPANTNITKEEIKYNTINMRSKLVLIYLKWEKQLEFKNYTTMNLYIKSSKKHNYIYVDDTVQVTHTVVLTLMHKTNLPQINYSSEFFHVSEPAAPFMSLTTPQNAMEVYNSGLKFKSSIPNFDHSPYGITLKGGIIYLKNWGPQAFPCGDACHSTFIIEWGMKAENNKTYTMGAKVFHTLLEKKPLSRRCKEQGKSDKHWESCGTNTDKKSCIRACGIGAQNGSHCSWRETRLPRNLSPDSESVLVTEYATCRGDPSSCPDGWCDPLEQLNPLLCPQDCTNHVSGGSKNEKTGRGIYSTSSKSVCYCDHRCSCKHRFPKGTKTVLDVETTQHYSTVEVHSTQPTFHIEFESYKPNAAYCDLTCKIVISVSSCVIFVFIISLIFFRGYCLSKRFGLLKSHAGDDGTMSIDPLVPLQTFSTSPTIITETLIDQTEVDTKWEIPRSRVEILETLGEGEFGKVLKAKVKDLPSKQGLSVVAVKTLKENSGTLELNDLLSEYSLLKEVNHPNVIKLLGACTSDGPIYVIIEYCSLGSLRSYLRKSRNAKAHECLEAGSSIEVTPKDILSFSWQICKGMSYLAEMKMVHRDLATRNILLAENKKCKISDFGMTRDVYVDDTYLKVSRSRVPVKWMALESLREHLYTSKSDVWSMGIVLWELVTLGSSPYPGIPAEKLYGLLTSGYRMPRPTNCSVRLYEIMRECWAKEPFRRPNFIQLTNKFEAMLGEDIEYLNCNIHAFSNPAYFNNGKPNPSMNNLDIRFSMSLDDLKSANINGDFNPYENELRSPNIVSYDVPKPLTSNTYLQSKKIKDKIIDEKVDNR